MHPRDRKGKQKMQEVESSRKVDKKAERERQAIEAILSQNPDAGVRIGPPPRSTQETSGSSQEQSTWSSTQQEQQSTNQNKRGPTKLHTIASTNVVEVMFNERGQPIDIGSVSLSSFVGSLSRELVPITLDDWRRFPQNEKERIWFCVKQRFKIDECRRNYIMKEVAHLWRCWKARVTHDLNVAIESGASDDYINAKVKPIEVDLNQWVEFRSQRSSPRFKEKSKKYQELRAKQTIPHTMSRKGYARLEEEMRKKRGLPDIPRADLWVEGHSNGEGRPYNDNIADVVPQSNNPPSKCGMKCKLLDWVVSTRIVAEGEVAIDDPMHDVDGVPLGRSAYMVWVERVFEPGAFLWRPRNDMRTIEKALGEMIPWPKECVVGNI